MFRIPKTLKNEQGSNKQNEQEFTLHSPSIFNRSWEETVLRFIITELSVWIIV